MKVFVVDVDGIAHYKAAREKLTRLARQGHEVVYVSSQPGTSEKALRKRLRKHKFPALDNVFVTRAKAGVVQAMAKPSRLRAKNQDGCVLVTHDQALARQFEHLVYRVFYLLGNESDWKFPW